MTNYTNPSVSNVFRTRRVLHGTDLLAVRMDNNTFTIYKNKEGLPHGTVVSEEEYLDMKNRAYYPIVLSEWYIEKDEQGNIVYQ
jgi:hypothetical protein